MRVSRVLPHEPVESLRAYRDGGGGRGLEVAQRVEPEAIVATVQASGLRGRGGAGFPTGTKWQTVAGFGSPEVPTTVVVNGAEGEPGTFKDRAIMRATPFAVVEGALIAARAVGADRVVVAVKSTFGVERLRLEQAFAEADEAGWCAGVATAVVGGPPEYLFGEETALLEVLDGRPPFPRITPPFRQGVDDVGPAPQEPAGVRMAQLEPADAPPTLVNNVETIANVPGILADGPEWFRSHGTEGSPGTVVCTVSGATRRHGVAEVSLGTPLQELIDEVGGGAESGHHLVAALSGIANGLVPVGRFDTPLTYEDLAAIGSGLGSAGFIVLDDRTDLAAVAAGMSRFLAVESCGQCTPCKQDGLALASLLAAIARSEGSEADVAAVADRTATVADEARCFLAQQHQRVLEGVFRWFPDALERHLDERAAPIEPAPIAPIVEMGADGRFVLEVHQLDKQPDWSFDLTDSGKPPVTRLAAGGPLSR